MSCVFETATVGRFAVSVESDDHATGSPRQYGGGGTFYTAHRRCDSPDDYAGDLFEAMARDLGIIAEPERDHDRRFLPADEFETDPAHVLSRARAMGCEVLPVFLCDHSGCSHRATEGGNPFSCKWDSGCVGHIWATPAEIRAWHGAKRVTAAARARAAANLKQDVDTWSAWASGDVWTYSIEDDNGEHVDSCGGFIGAADHCQSEGLDAARRLAERDRKTRACRLKHMIRAGVPLACRAAILGDFARSFIEEAPR